MTANYTVSALCLMVGFAAGVQPNVAECQQVPAGLTAVVAQVHNAARRKDYAALRASMAETFTWSFGGDASAEQAISEWTKDSKYLKRLASATRAKCEWIDKGVVQCPRNAGAAFRAGFEQVDGRWKMTYFVAGD